jgi:alcohol dehydrogenase
VRESGTLSGEYSYLPIERVHFGQGSIGRLSEELDRLGSKRPFLITGKTIAEQTDLSQEVEDSAGRKLAGTFSGVKQHAPQSGIIEATRQAKLAGADAVISLGGGSPIDAAKIVVKQLSEDFTRPAPPHIAIPTTLSAAEFSHAAGMTDEGSRRKVGFRDPRLAPRVVFLDPEMTVPTPAWLWGSSGIRSLDHAVEAVYSPRHQPFVDVLALEAIRLLFQNLKESTADPSDFGRKLNCQMAAWMSFAGVLSVGTGLSHAIGRTVGATWNIPHGITSCLTLAEVMKMEASRGPERLILIAKAEGRKLDGLDEKKAALEASLGVGELVRALGLSKRLRDYGIARDDLSRIARESTGAEDYSKALRVLEAIF